MPPLCARIEALAERDPRRAVTIARRALANTHDDGPQRAWATWTLGWALLCWERFDEARPHLHEAAARFATRNDTYGTLRCRQGLLLADQIQFARPDLDQGFADLADAFTSVGDHPQATHARLYQAVVFNVKGQVQEAQQILAQIDLIYLESDKINQVRFLRIQGFGALVNGDYATATTLLTQSEELAKELKNRFERARVWFEQGGLAVRQEQVDTALEIYHRAERIFVTLDLPLRLAFCAKAIGLAQSRRGEYDLALDSILTALHHFSRVGRTTDIAGCQLNLGNIYLHTGSWEAALACYNRAEQLYTTAGVVNELLSTKRNRANIYRAQQRYTEALALLEEVEQEANAIRNRGELAEVYGLRANILADTEQLPDALVISTQAYHLFEEIGNMPGAAECLLERAWLWLRCGRPQYAQPLIQQAYPDLKQHAHSRWRIEYGLARCAQEEGRIDEALMHYRQAAALVAGLRRRIASEEISSNLYLQAEELYEDGLNLAVDEGDVATVLALSESRRALVLQRMLDERLPSPEELFGAEHQALRQRISALLPVDEQPADPQALDEALAAYGELLLHARHSPSLAGACTTPRSPAPPFELEQVRAALDNAYGSDWSVLSYAFTRDRLLTTVITSDGMWQEETIAERRLFGLLEEMTQRTYRDNTFRDLPFFHNPATGRWKTPGAMARRLLPPSLLARLHPDHRLIVIPAGQLHALPWAALWLDGSWLVEQAIIQVAPSLTTVQQLAGRPAPGSKGALLLGCGEFGRRAEPLPGVAQELATLAELHGARATIAYPAPRAALFDRSATGELATYGRIHIASHGKLLGQRGLAAHLKLADEDLLLPEVAALRIDGSLVTLSACDGAAADVLPGEEVFSLSHAFLAAGASSILASQWPVYDLAVIPFMADFYTALDTTGDPALALALTQRKHIHAFADPTDRRGLPFCWGSFVLVGGLHGNG